MNQFVTNLKKSCFWLNVTVVALLLFFGLDFYLSIVSYWKNYPIRTLIFPADNVFAIRTWCQRKFSIDLKILDKQFGIPEELDYIEWSIYKFYVRKETLRNYILFVYFCQIVIFFFWNVKKELLSLF